MVALPVLDDDVPDDDLPQRPKTRGDCVDGPRPCPWASCRYHLSLDPRDGSLALRGTTGLLSGDPYRAPSPATVAAFVDRAVDDITSGLPTCALDVADEGEQCLEQVGEVLGVSRERIRQVEVRALRAMRHPTRRVHLGSASVAHDGGAHAWIEPPDQDDGE